MGRVFPIASARLRNELENIVRDMTFHKLILDRLLVRIRLLLLGELSVLFNTVTIAIGLSK